MSSPNRAPMRRLGATQPGPGGRRGAKALWALLLAAAWGCVGASGGGGPVPAGPADAGCTVLPPERTATSTERVATNAEPTDPGAPILVGVSGALDRSAPLPRTPAARLLAVHLHETVVQVDCEGRVLPGLAEAWDAEEGGRVWTFRLRADARDPRGSPVSAADVASSWLRAQGAASGAGLPPEIPVRPPLPELTAVIVRDARTLRVELRAPVEAGRFALPELAVRTGPAGAGGDAPGGRLQLAGSVQLLPVPADGRDALDAGVELLATSDPLVIAYAGRLPGYRVVPLGWDRTYFLAAPVFRGEGFVVAAPGEESPPLAGPTLDELIQDAVRAGARPAREASNPAACFRPDPVGAPGRAASARPAPRVVYPAGDPVARGVAERLVALTLDRSPSGGGWARAFGPAGGAVTLRAVGLDERTFLQALRAGRDAAYVVPAEGTGSSAVSAAYHAAPWVEREAADPAEPHRRMLLPLIETRRALVAAPGLEGVAVDGAGLLRLHGLRRTAGEEVR